MNEDGRTATGFVFPFVLLGPWTEISIVVSWRVSAEACNEQWNSDRACSVLVHIDLSCRECGGQRGVRQKRRTVSRNINRPTD